MKAAQSETPKVDRSLPFSVRDRRQHGGGGVMSLNLTPMIDVVFLLLFFFLAVSRFQGTEGMLAGQLPRRSTAVSMDIPITPIRVQFIPDPVSGDRCQVMLADLGDSRPMAISELAEALRAIVDTDAGKTGFDRSTPVHLLAGDDVRWDHVVNAYNAAIEARFEKVYFAGS